MTFFQNPNAKSVVVTRVPCSFAKAVKGQVGTHYTEVILDDLNAVMYVGSECEHKHGEAVQAMAEMGGITCFSVTAQFRKILNAVKSAPHQEVYGRTLPLDDTLMPQILKHSLSVAWHAAAGTHNLRVKEWNKQNKSLFLGENKIKGPAMQAVVNRLTGHMLSLPTKTRRGKHPERVAEHARTEVCYPQLLSVGDELRSIDISEYYNSNGERLGEEGYGSTAGKLYLAPTNNGHRTFAVRSQSTWFIKEDEIKAWASVCCTGIVDTRWSNVIPENMCIFCNKKFTRMSKHTGGASHIARVMEVVRLVCKATTPVGLKMINNPKHRSVFFRGV